MILGLTGGYCAGKNAVAAVLAERGWTCIDVDKLGHEAVELSREAIVARFGAEVLGPDGRVDRRALARIVFSDGAALADQEAIIHPIAIRLLEERMAEAEGEARAAGLESRVCLNAALLYLAPQAARCDAIVEVRASVLIRLIRAMARDDLDIVQAARRIWRQRHLWPKRKATGRPIVVLRNEGRRNELPTKVDRVLRIASARAERAVKRAATPAPEKT
jgi:dephospho-CoA kinase